MATLITSAAWIVMPITVLSGCQEVNHVAFLPNPLGWLSAFLAVVSLFATRPLLSMPYGFSRKIGFNSRLAFFDSGPERIPNGFRTDAERTPNGP